MQFNVRTCGWTAALSLGFVLFGCGAPDSTSKDAAKPGADGKQAATATREGTARRLPFKIGVMTGTVSQGEDEYRGGERVVAKYGDRIKHVTYPDNFMTEQETVIAQILNLAADPEVKAIVIEQGIPGSISAIKKVKESRPEMKFILGNPHEDPEQVSQYADLCLIPDELRRGQTIIDIAHKMGAKAFVHYSFPRHMSQELLSQRKDIMEARCKEHGMQFVFQNAPDPTGDQGLPGAQQFILEDVPKQVAKYGADTAFFSTNCGMQEPLIRSVLDQHAILPEQCCPSPTHGYPGALGIPISKEASGDMKMIREAIAASITAKGNHGRMATWPVSIGIVTIEVAVELAIQAVEGTIQLTDASVIKAELEKGAGVAVTLEPYQGKNNYYFVLLESVIF